MTLEPELLDDRIAYHDDAVPFVLLWSEKAGCTALLTWFLVHAGHYEEASTYRQWVHHWEIDVMRRRPGHLERLRDRILAGTPVFKLVRDPFARVVSSYLSLLELPEGADHATIPMRRDVRRLVYGRDDVPYSFSLRHYLDWLRGQDLERIDGHHRLQSTPLDVRLAELGVDVTPLRLERLDDELRSLEDRFGLDHVDRSGLVTPPHHVARLADVVPDRRAVADLQPPIPLADGPPLPRPADFMAPDVVETVAALFRRDIEAFDYPVPAAASHEAGASRS